MDLEDTLTNEELDELCSLVFEKEWTHEEIMAYDHSTMLNRNYPNRGYEPTTNYNRFHEEKVVLLQRFFRRNTLTRMNPVVRIQATVRMFLVKKILTKTLTMTKATVYIQATVRMFLAKRFLLKNKTRVVQIQANARMFLAMRRRIQMENSVRRCKLKSCSKILHNSVKGEYCRTTNCGHKYSIDCRWKRKLAATDKENTPVTKRMKRCARCKRVGHNTRTCTNITPGYDVITPEPAPNPFTQTQVVLSQEEYQQFMAVQMNYQQLLQVHEITSLKLALFENMQ